jgi:Na+-driven multidrug efflux pump
MIGMVTGAVLNIGLDPIFIFTCGWGVAGASAATAISKLVSWTILMIPYWRKRTLLTIRLSQFRPRWKDAKEVCSMGSASFFRGGLGTLAAIILNRIAVTFGTSALAAISVANRITMFMTSACLGFGQGFQPVAGYSWGARRYDRVRESFHFSLWACVLGISAVAALVAVFARPLLLLFTEDDAELVRIGVFSLRIQCLAMPFHGFGIIVNMLCAGIGRPVPTLLLGMSRQGICFFPILPVMVKLFGVWGVASVQGVADILVMAMAVPIALRVMRDVRRREAEQPADTPPATVE